jgi:zinc/manganese transport system permease protein
MNEAALAAPALAGAAAGALALSFGAAPLGVLLIGRRMSLVGDALSHAILPGAAIAFLVAGGDTWALTVGALAAGVIVAILSSLLARTRRLPEDASFAVLYLSALALGVLILGRASQTEVIHGLLFGDVSALDAGGLIFAAGAATATILALALFVRGFVAEAADPLFMRASGLPGGLLHTLLMCLVALNLVAGFRAFGALMTVGLMMVPAAAARFWARGFAGQVGAAVLISTAASAAGLVVARALEVEPGAAMVLAAAVLFLVSAATGPHRSLLQSLPGRPHLEG